MSKQRLLIIGGGFAGVKAALSLCSDDRFSVQLVSNHPDFRYYPALYRSATGGSRRISAIPLINIFEHHHVAVLQDTAIRLDRTKKELHTKNGEVLKYDTLIIALGVVTNYFDIKGLKEYSYGIKSIEEAEKLKQHLHKQMIRDSQPDLNYVVVGAGPTGIELAGALPSYLRQIMKQHNLKQRRRIHVELVEAAPRVMPRMSKDISRAFARRLKRLGVHIYTNQKVEAETADSLVVNNKPIKSHTVVWTAGVTNNPFLKDNQFMFSSHGRVRVNEYMQAEPNIYVLGDNAETPYSGMAQTALYDALFVANNIKRAADGQLQKTYKPKRPIYVTPTGPKWAAVVWGPMRFYGRIGWGLRRLADLVAYHDFEPWWPASQLWVAETASEDDCPLCEKPGSNLSV